MCDMTEGMARVPAPTTVAGQQTTLGAKKEVDACGERVSALVLSRLTMLLIVEAWPPWPSLPPLRRVLPRSVIVAARTWGQRTYLDMSRAPSVEALLPSVMVE